MTPDVDSHLICCLQAAATKRNLPLNRWEKLYGKDQGGDFQLSCDLGEAEMQYRDLILTVGLPKDNPGRPPDLDRCESPCLLGVRC